MIHCLYGIGKGKTTSAVGQVIRLLAYDKKVLFIQFLKDGNSGEVKTLKQLGVDVVYDNLDFEFDFKDEQCVKKMMNICDDLFNHINETYDVIVLDEILDAITLSFINEGKVYDTLKNMKDDHEIIVTGRMPNHKLKSLFDYSSEIKKIKHPSDLNFAPRKGIEY